MTVVRVATDAQGQMLPTACAFGLWAPACAATAHLASGYELADSWASDGHRWPQTPYDCGYAIVRDAEAHRRAMTIAVSYLPSAAEAAAIQPISFPELSRRARGFATCAMIRHLGRAGVAVLVQGHCRLAARFAERLVPEPGVHVLNDVVINQVIVRFGAPEPDETADRLTRETILHVQTDGTCFAGGVQWRDRWVMRLSVISAPTTEADIDRSCEAICKAWRSVARSNLTAGTHRSTTLAHLSVRRS